MWQVYRDITLLLENESCTVVTETPDIGKSFYLVFLYYKFKVDKCAIALQLDHKKYILDEHPRAVNLDLFEWYLKDTIYLYDPMGCHDSLLPFVWKMTILCSPDKHNNRLSVIFKNNYCNWHTISKLKRR